MGYITHGKGVAVHSVQCPNVQNLMYEVERKIDVEWVRSTSEPLPVKVIIYTDDRPGILNQVTSILNAESSNIRSLEARGDTTGRTKRPLWTSRWKCAIRNSWTR